MSIMLELGLSVSGVLLFPCLPLQLRNLSVFLTVVVLSPLGRGRFLHLVVMYGYQGADRELALTDQLLDAAFGELGVVAREQPCVLLAISAWSPSRSLAWQKGSRLGSGLTLKLLGDLLLVGSLG